MARVLYLDCFSGAAGDMLLGAFIDAGLPIDALKQALGSLGVEHELTVARVLRAGVSATHVHVAGPAVAAPRSQPAADHGHPHPHGRRTDGTPSAADDRPNAPHHSLAAITRLIESSALSAAGKARAIALFQRLAEAEAAIHDTTLEAIHLHEVGAIDSIIDICGAVFAFEWFGIDDVVASPLNLGGGSVAMTHGRYPVPAPATLRLLTGIPVSSSGLQSELVTPTGALLVSDYAKSYGPFPAMTVAKIGYGAGTKDFQSRPNVLRVVMGERTSPAMAAAGADAGEVVTKIECEIDDMSPQLFGVVTERLLGAGALDVFLTAVQMKKGRPGTLLTVLARPGDRRPLTDLLFRETTTIGVRFEEMRREVLERRWEEVHVTGGVVRMKVAGRGGDVLTATPEFDDCLRISTATGQPVKAVQAEAMRAWAR